MTATATRPIKTRAAALKRARELWGDKAFAEQRKRTEWKGVQYPTNQAEQVQLAILRDQHAAARPTRPDLEAWDGADTVANYRAAMRKYGEELKAWREREQAIETVFFHPFPFSIGTHGKLAVFSTTTTLGEGFSWDEAFEKAARRG